MISILINTLVKKNLTSSLDLSDDCTVNCVLVAGKMFLCKLNLMFIIWLRNMVII